jgi:hypothetical protein
MRIYHDGYSKSWIGLQRGKRCPRVSFISFDGVRLRIAYGSPEIRVATIYIADPSPLYSVEESWRGDGLALNNLPIAPKWAYRIRLKREVEEEMLRNRYRYPHGRIGSEIAYAIACRHMGRDRLVLNDPSEGGADMMSRNREIVFENRLITVTRGMSAGSLERQVIFQLEQLKTRLLSDLLYYDGSRIGYISLSFLDSEGLRTLVWEMRK